ALMQNSSDSNSVDVLSLIITSNSRKLGAVYSHTVWDDPNMCDATVLSHVWAVPNFMEIISIRYKVQINVKRGTM
ncbi:13487_t:CDS:2, partial [Gigaspora rosea]